MNKEFWDERYASEEFAYGVAPNEFIKEVLPQYEPCAILFPADGEGRNSVFAATLGYEVFSFDLSDSGKEKALKLAESKSVQLDYRVDSAAYIQYEQNQFGAIAFVFAHFPANVKYEYNRKLLNFLMTGGYVFFEAFSKQHLLCQEKYPKVGGPKDIDMLFSEEELLKTFVDFDTILLETREIELSEGPFHQGIGSVVRYIGRKK
jgi:SAM-dependent methyltransferase